jgi:hypothetical protein
MRCFFPATSFLPAAGSPLLLRVVVSTGSGANRRTFLVVSSMGMAWKRLEAGGGEVSGMLIAELICVRYCNDLQVYVLSSISCIPEFQEKPLEVLVIKYR